MTDNRLIFKDSVEFAEALGNFLLGQRKQLAITAALSVAVNTAILEGISKLELQRRLVEMYDRNYSKTRT